MTFKIRQEEPRDHQAVFHLIEKAFEKEEMSDHKEQFLVERLRRSVAFIPELSLVAEKEGQIVGHILLTKIQILDGPHSYPSLALAPVSVLPDYQKQGIGAILIEKAHLTAKDLGYHSVILLGHAGYYPRFGYERAAKYGIQLPFEVPEENCMAIELVENGLKGVSGTVEYPKEFFE